MDPEYLPFEGSRGQSKRKCLARAVLVQNLFPPLARLVVVVMVVVVVEVDVGDGARGVRPAVYLG